MAWKCWALLRFLINRMLSFQVFNSDECPTHSLCIAEKIWHHFEIASNWLIYGISSLYCDNNMACPKNAGPQQDLISDWHDVIYTYWCGIPVLRTLNRWLCKADLMMKTWMFHSGFMALYLIFWWNFYISVAWKCQWTLLRPNSWLNPHLPS